MAANKIIIILLSIFLSWSQGAPNPGQMATLNNRAEGFFYFPTRQSFNSFMRNGNLLSGFERDNLFRAADRLEVNQETTIQEFNDGKTEMALSSPNYDGTTTYEPSLNQETTIQASPGKHVLLEFLNMDLEEGRPYQGCIYDWVEVRTTETEGEKLCGTERPSGPMLSKGAEMTVVFHSDRVFGRTGYSATVTEVSKVEEDSFVENYLNWGPEYRISFDLMILKEAAELQSIFAFLGRHFATVPQILLEGLTLRFTTSDYMSGKRNVKYETDINIHQWTPIVIETRQGTDNTYNFVISVAGVEHTEEDVSAPAVLDVSAWDTHFALTPAAAVYKNLVIDPTGNVNQVISPAESAESSDENSQVVAAGRSSVESNVGAPFSMFNGWVNPQTPDYTIAY